MNMTINESIGKNESRNQGDKAQNNYFFFGEFEYLDLIEEDEENEDYLKNFENGISNLVDENSNISILPVIASQKEASSDIKKNVHNQTNCYKNAIPNMNFKEFKEYLNFKINGDKNKKVMKESLMIIHYQLQYYLHISPLSRAEKRDKNKILHKFFNYSTELLNYIETMPNFLRPALLHLRNKDIIRKVKLYQKKAYAKNK